MCLHLIEEVLIRLSLLIARQERLELLAVFQEVKIEHRRFSSDINQLLCLKLNWTVLICIKAWERNPARKLWRMLLSMTEAPQCSRSPGDFIRPQPSTCFQRKLWMTSKGNKWKIICFIRIGLWMTSVFLKNQLLTSSVVIYVYKTFRWKNQRQMRMKNSKGTENNPFCWRKYGKDSEYELVHLPRHHVLKREWIGVKRKQL